ncbi:hypothetical protein [Granulosicoccus antarcticus]|uniref:Uncharacterized protein n=1 Tax=Granulosicoccus antarcticus IMCC3135 TaxID=1192854 RepID=A0A2Z2NUU7_9GAMM|nr:hypothetical protein [Granulosicoccus antarcticus]ASJ74285.1 hypothetical protein IMCC3135_21040 [Granulosicoccus antarcticus IMCC3135]
MIHTSILGYRSARYLWVTIILIAISIGIYISQSGSDQPANGGTWQGYTTGTLGALLILWLSLLGVRKRRYRSRTGSVAGWTSAHVYLGTSVIIIGTLHSAGQLGWNIHSLAYVLMCTVVVSGFFGIYYYVSLPDKLLLNRGGRSREALFEELHKLDAEGRSAAELCSSDITVGATSAIERTSIGGGVAAQLLRSDNSNMSVPVNGKPKIVENKDQARVLTMIAARIPDAQRKSEVEPLSNLMSIMGRRQAVIRRIVRDIQLQGLLKVWLYLHIPLTFALLVSLVAHIISTFLYW